MKKIYDAAFEVYPITGDWRQDTTNADMRTGFKAGARYVLDAMTNDETIRNAIKCVIEDGGGFGEDQTRTAVMAAGRAIDAVRKEIEGE